MELERFPKCWPTYTVAVLRASWNQHNPYFLFISNSILRREI